MRKILNETNFSTSRKNILLCKPVVLYLFEIVAQSKKLAAHLSIKGDQNDICNMTVFLHTFSDILRLGYSTATLCVAVHRLRNSDVNVRLRSFE